MATFAKPAAAIEYPWCAQPAGNNRGNNCGFVSWEQCMQTIRGNGGDCARNQFYTAPSPERRRVRHNKSRRSHRHAAGSNEGR
jgi:hypothetical protein